ncbi:hypothetical protein FRC0043_02210 [Corynebacterium belfantii]|nr:hypothetical protein FRC0043_02210 [Corynebacterium belfantii]
MTLLQCVEFAFDLLNLTLGFFRLTHCLANLLRGDIPRLLQFFVFTLLDDNWRNLGQLLVGVLIDIGVHGHDEVRIVLGNGFGVDFRILVDTRLIAFNLLV